MELLIWYQICWWSFLYKFNFRFVDQPQPPYTPGHLKSRKATGSKTPRFLLRFYYFWRPRFASFCHDLPFRPIILDSMCLHRALRKVRQNAADRAFTGRISRMIKILFVCHGRVFLFAWDPCIYRTFGRIWLDDRDTFGTIEDCDIAQNSRCRLLPH